MLVYRIGKSKYANDLTGEGAKLYGGRWNHEGIPCIYAAETRALSLLEYSVHITIEAIPPSLKFTSIEIPNNLIHEIKRAELPANWQNWPHPKEARDFGNKLLIANKQLAIRFPSAIIPEEFIYIINPVHQHMRQVSVKKIADISYDLRLKR
jgi:RES domain-containing protein